MSRSIFDGVMTEEEFKRDVITMLYGGNRPKKKQPHADKEKDAKEEAEQAEKTADTVPE